MIPPVARFCVARHYGTHGSEGEGGQGQGDDAGTNLIVGAACQDSSPSCRSTWRWGPGGRWCCGWSQVRISGSVLRAGSLSVALSMKPGSWSKAQIWGGARFGGSEETRKILEWTYRPGSYLQSWEEGRRARQDLGPRNGPASAPVSGRIAGYYSRPCWLAAWSHHCHGHCSFSLDP